MSIFSLRNRRTFSFFFVMILATLSLHAQALPKNLGDSATPIDLGKMVRGAEAQAGTPNCYRVEVPTAGLVMIDVSTSGPAGHEARIGGFDPSVHFVYRSPAHLLLSSRGSRTVDFCVGGVDPLHRLKDYRLRTSFKAHAGRGVSTKEEDPEEIELEPDGLRGDLTSLCGTADDHGDALLCATPMTLGQALSGEVRGGWSGADHDLFAFEIRQTTTVQIHTSGPTDTFGSLYDIYGQSLHQTDGGRPGDENFRFVKTLRPGLYFVRVEASHHDEGPYSLKIRALHQAW